ncbi:hypothetical protein [Levilactobacillus yonginensis]
MAGCQQRFFGGLATVVQDVGYAATVYTHSKVKHGYFAPVAVNLHFL